MGHRLAPFLTWIIISSRLMQNDDEDIVYMYTGYTHKLMMCFISHPTSRDKVRGILH
jgi:nuclear pore complex protein Nup205